MGVDLDTAIRLGVADAVNPEKVCRDLIVGRAVVLERKTSQIVVQLVEWGGGERLGFALDRVVPGDEQLVRVGRRLGPRDQNFANGQRGRKDEGTLYRVDVETKSPGLVTIRLEIGFEPDLDVGRHGRQENPYHRPTPQFPS